MRYLQCSKSGRRATRPRGRPLFGFAALREVVLNKTMSLVVVSAAPLPARLAAVSITDLAGPWPVMDNLLAGSLAAAWAGATWATPMRSATLYRS